MRSTYRRILTTGVAFVLAAASSVATAAVIRVNTPQDTLDGNDGRCSLREAIIASNDNTPSGMAAGECNAGETAPLRDRIRFAGQGTITLDAGLGCLPALTDGYTSIDGYSAPGVSFGQPPAVGLNGAQIQSFCAGLSLRSSRNMVRGLIIGHFTFGISIGVEAEGNWIQGNAIGTSRFGNQPRPNDTGIYIEGGAGPNNLIGTNGDGTNDVAEGNLISGNEVGIELAGLEASIVAGNRIGTNRAGTLPMPNEIGVYISGSNDRIGTDGDGVADAAEGNLISGNTEDGIRVESGGDVTIAGNRIGLNAAGTAALPNDRGISVFVSDRVLIGTDGQGNDEAKRNLVSGNRLGISIDESDDCVVAGNWIGTDATGTVSISNRQGILMLGSDNTIGGDRIADGNRIAGSTEWGIWLPAAENTTIQCNTIGTDVTGTGVLGNAVGVVVGNFSSAPHSIRMQGNRVRYNQIGLDVFFPGMTVNHNDIVGNGIGYRLDPSAPITFYNAQDNWWGDDTGPDDPLSNPGGMGDTIVVTSPAAVDSSNWLSEVPTEYCRR